MMKLDVSVLNMQKAQEKIIKELQSRFSDAFVTVGIHEDAGGSAEHPDSDGITNAQLGATLHYGAKIKHPGGYDIEIPPRPWLDVGVASGNQRYLKIIEDTIDKDDPIESALEKIGIEAVGFTQKYMTELRNPPNAKSTIAAKGSDNPLINKGLLRQSITYKITSNEPDEGVE